MSKEPRGKQNGFSLVEILVATMILTFGLLAMASATGYVAAQLRATTFDTQRTQAKQRIIEQIRATRFSTIVTSSSATAFGRYSFTWAVTQNNSRTLKSVTLVTTGPAYRQGRGARSTVVDTTYFEVVAP